jgi:hypothetical protein
MCVCVCVCVLEMSTAFSDACVRSFPHVQTRRPREEFLCHGNGSPEEILSICLAQENWQMYPWTHPGKLSKKEMPGSVRQWTLVALEKKASLHLDFWKETDALPRAGYNMTWPAWALVQSQPHCVFIFVLNFSQFYPPINNTDCLTFRSSCTKFLCCCGLRWHILMLSIIPLLAEVCTDMEDSF